MWYYLMKVLLSSVVIVAVSEAAKRSSLIGALIAALPLTSLLAILWMHLEHTETLQIIQLSRSIFFLVIPSLLFFVLFPYLLERGIAFWWSLLIAVSATVAVYLLMVRLLGVFRISL